MHGHVWLVLVLIPALVVAASPGATACLATPAQEYSGVATLTKWIDGREACQTEVSVTIHVAGAQRGLARVAVSGECHGFGGLYDARQDGSSWDLTDRSVNDGSSSTGKIGAEGQLGLVNVGTDEATGRSFHVVVSGPLRVFACFET